MFNFVFMRQTAIYNISNIEFFKKRLSSWASVFEQSAVLEGTIDENNGMYLKYDMLVGVDAIDELFSEKIVLINYITSIIINRIGFLVFFHMI